jgi:hypothetical protein
MNDRIVRNYWVCQTIRHSRRVSDTFPCELTRLQRRSDAGNRLKSPERLPKCLSGFDFLHSLGVIFLSTSSEHNVIEHRSHVLQFDFLCISIPSASMRIFYDLIVNTVPLIPASMRMFYNLIFFLIPIQSHLCRLLLRIFNVSAPLWLPACFPSLFISHSSFILSYFQFSGESVRSSFVPGNDENCPIPAFICMSYPILTAIQRPISAGRIQFHVHKISKMWQSRNNRLNTEAIDDHGFSIHGTLCRGCYC